MFNEIHLVTQYLAINHLLTRSLGSETYANALNCVPQSLGLKSGREKKQALKRANVAEWFIGQTPAQNQEEQNMSEYQPPKVWKWNQDNGGRFANINRPTAGAIKDKDLPRGKHPLQLYSLATPNGVKVTVMLEELLAMGFNGAEYDAYLVRINEGDQFDSGFVEINPNSKIPVLLDQSTDKPTRVFESGAILLYLAEKFSALLPTDPHKRAEALNWLFWQMGSGPFLGGGFGHFYAYAPEKIEYAIDRSRWK